MPDLIQIENQIKEIGLESLLRVVNSKFAIIDLNFLLNILMEYKEKKAGYKGGKGDPNKKPIGKKYKNIALGRVSGFLAQEVIGVEGVLQDTTSYSELAAFIRESQGDPEVDRLILLVQSGGGILYGIADVLLAIEEFKKAGKKVFSIISGLGASAAYWIASAADKIIAVKYSDVGSIGVFVVIPDFSALFERSGIKINLVSSGALKGIGIAGVPIGDDFLAAEKENILAVFGDFKGYVQNKRPSVRQEVFNGGVFVADRALDFGLVDMVAFSEEEALLTALQF